MPGIWIQAVGWTSASNPVVMLLGRSMHSMFFKRG
jgi:hypothetical protein